MAITAFLSASPSPLARGRKKEEFDDPRRPSGKKRKPNRHHNHHNRHNRNRRRKRKRTNHHNHIHFHYYNYSSNPYYYNKGPSCKYDNNGLQTSRGYNEDDDNRGIESGARKKAR